MTSYPLYLPRNDVRTFVEVYFTIGRDSKFQEVGKDVGFEIRGWYTESKEKERTTEKGKRKGKRGQEGPLYIYIIRLYL